jgi:hypothetical protein
MGKAAMTPRRRFRPGEAWTLEDRIALSHAAPADSAITSQETSLNATFNGSFRFTATIVRGFGEQDKVAGASRIPRVGLVKLSGTIQQSENPFSPSLSTFGTLFLVAKGRTATVELSQTGDIFQSSPIRFVVKRGLGPFASFVGDQGTVDLNRQYTRQSNGSSGITKGHGTFTLQFSQDQSL